MDNEKKIKIGVQFDAKQAMQEIEELKRKFAELKEQNVNNTNITKGITSQLNNATKIVSESIDKINVKLSDIGRPSNYGELAFVERYKQTINEMIAQAEKYHRLYKETGDIKYQQQYQALIPTIRQLTNEHDNFSKMLGLTNKQANLVSNTFKEMKHHMQWALSGALLGGILSIPYATFSSIKEIDREMAGLLQTLPQLYKDHENNVTDKQALAKLTQELITLTHNYGVEVTDVTESMKLWTRGYKDIETASKLASNSMKLSVADNINDVKKANQAIEAIISSFQRQSDAVNFSNHVVDAITNIAHNSQAAAKDILEALERTSAAAHTVGVSFDFVASMASVMIRNTGQTGNIVGNSLKALFSSIHSDRGIAELQKLGIAVYEFDTQGQKHFRNVEKVLLDLMITAQTTGMNMENVFKKISGGNFQWNRVSAMANDYQEFIRVWGLSLNSVGMADKQVLAQMDTIQRKLEQVKASFAGMATSAGDAGLTQFIKDKIDAIDTLLQGLRRVPAEMWQTIGLLGKLATILFVIKTTVTFLDSGFINVSKAMSLFTVTTNAQTVATSRLAVATTLATGGLNILVGLLALAGTGALAYGMALDDTNSSAQKLYKTTQDEIMVKQQQIEMQGKQAEFVKTLAEAYRKYQNELSNVSNDEQKANKIKKDMQVTEKELTKILGEEAAERIKQSGYSQDAINAEVNNFNNKSEQMKTDIKRLQEQQAELTKNTITAANERINAINNEAQAFDKAADAISEALGKISEYHWRYLKWKSSFYKEGAERIRKEGKTAHDGGFMGGDWGLDAETMDNLSAQADAQAKEISDSAKQTIINNAKLGQLGNIYQPQGNRTSGIVTDDNKEKGKGKDSNLPDTDHRKEKFKLEVGRELPHLLAMAKADTDRYGQSLDNVNFKQEIFGVTTENIADKLNLMKQRTSDLLALGFGYNSMSQQYTDKANDMIAANSMLVAQLDEQKLSWKSLTREEKHNFIEANKDIAENYREIQKYLELADKAETASADAMKNANKTAIEQTKTMLRASEEKYRNNISSLGYDKEHAIFNLGRFASQQQKDTIELMYAIQELAQAEQRLKEIENQPSHSELDLKKQQQEVDTLKRKVEELNDTWAEVRGGLAGITSEILVQGNKWENIWRKLWNDLANDAIKALFRVQNSTPSLLGQILGLFGGGRVSTYNPSTIKTVGGIPMPPKPAHNGEYITGYPKMHNGGLVDKLKNDEVIRTLQVGERVLSKEDNQKFETLIPQLLSKGTQVVPYFSAETQDLLKQTQALNADAARTKAHIEEIQKTNELLTNIIQVLIANKESNHGQPVIMPVAPDVETVLNILQANSSFVVDMVRKEEGLNNRI